MYSCNFDSLPRRDSRNFEVSMSNYKYCCSNSYPRTPLPVAASTVCFGFSSASNYQSSQHSSQCGYGTLFSPLPLIVSTAVFHRTRRRSRARKPGELCLATSPRTESALGSKPSRSLVRTLHSFRLLLHACQRHVCARVRTHVTSINRYAAQFEEARVTGTALLAVESEQQLAEEFGLPCLASPLLASPRVASRRLASPRLASPRLACLAVSLHAYAVCLCSVHTCSMPVCVVYSYKSYVCTSMLHSLPAACRHGVAARPILPAAPACTGASACARSWSAGKRPACNEGRRTEEANTAPSAVDRDDGCARNRAWHR